MIKEEFVMVMKPIKEIVRRDYFCDLCGEQIHRGNYSQETSKVIIRDGYVYPEGGSYEETSTYFCEACSNKIKDTLENMGVKFNTTYIDI